MSYINAQNQALRAALMANFLVAELLVSRVGLAGGDASKVQLWLISPWITDFSLSLPPGSDISALLDGAETQPRLFEVLRQIASNGGQVYLLVRPEREPRRLERFIKPLVELTQSEPNIYLRQLPDLHVKLYVGQSGALYGSLNLTESGIERNVEFSTFYSDARNIARLKAEAQALYKSAQEVSG